MNNIWVEQSLSIIRREFVTDPPARCKIVNKVAGYLYDTQPEDMYTLDYFTKVADKIVNVIFEKEK